MSTVETVNGSVAVNELGVTLIHEHLRFRGEAVAENWPTRYDTYEHLPHYFENRDANEIVAHW